MILPIDFLWWVIFTMSKVLQVFHHYIYHVVSNNFRVIFCSNSTHTNGCYRFFDGQTYFHDIRDDMIGFRFQRQCGISSLEVNFFFMQIIERLRSECVLFNSNFSNLFIKPSSKQWKLYNMEGVDHWLLYIRV